MKEIVIRDEINNKIKVVKEDSGSIYAKIEQFGSDVVLLYSDIRKIYDTMQLLRRYDES